MIDAVSTSNYILGEQNPDIAYNSEGLATSSVILPLDHDSKISLPSSVYPQK